MATKTSDFLIVGGGVVGLSCALAARRRFPAARIVLIEKESACGLHASGRNSGVIHAGFYYSADSLKAQLTKAGNIALREYCEQHKIPVLNCGKAVVASSQNDLATFEVLLDRARSNGVPLEKISAGELHEIEPAAYTLDSALWSPTTAAVDPQRVMAALVDDAKRSGIEILTDTRFLGVENGEIDTSAGPISAGYTINAAGLYADKVARDFGVVTEFVILPFKGVYLEAPAAEFALGTHIYPAPDLKYPFLGVHLTVSASAKVKIGPTAIPALWREQYSGFDNFSAAEMGVLIAHYLGYAFTPGSGAMTLAGKEFPKYIKSTLLRRASVLVKNKKLDAFSKWGRAGIRAQLFDTRKKGLVMDFCIRQAANSMHILNAVSPAFTCAIPFAEHVFDQIESGAAKSEIEARQVQA